MIENPKMNAEMDLNFIFFIRSNQPIKPIIANPIWYLNKKLNEANYQGAQKANVVTLRNTSGSTIYVERSLSRNRGTKLEAGSTAKWDCDHDAYIQINNNTTNTKVYSKNTGCGNTVTVR